jgi:hypothetical protein
MKRELTTGIRLPTLPPTGPERAESHRWHSDRFDGLGHCVTLSSRSATVKSLGHMRSGLWRVFHPRAGVAGAPDVGDPYGLV